MNRSTATRDGAGALRRLLAYGVLSSALFVAACHRAPPQMSSLPVGCSLGRAPAGSRVLVYSHTTGYRHASIPAAVVAIRQLGVEHGFEIEHTEDPTRFRDTTLARFSAVVFLSNTQRVLDSTGRMAFQRYIRAGHGYVGIHASSNAEIDWPWYGELMGAFFRQHPIVQTGVVLVADATHPSTRCLPAKWERPDEWYNFKTPPAAGARVLLTVDEKSYQGGTMGDPHPLAWYREFDGGRAWYTAIGHFDEHYTDPVYRSHIVGGILWAIGK